MIPAFSFLLGSSGYFFNYPIYNDKNPYIYGTFVFRPSTKGNIRRLGLLAILRQPFAYFHTRDQLSLQQKKLNQIFSFLNT